MLKNMAEMLKKGKLYPDKLLWRVMADSAQVIDGHYDCLLYTSDAADEEDRVEIGGRRNIEKKKRRERKGTR